MRINQYLAMATDLSRRAADAAVEAGRVTVEGLPAQLGQEVPATTKVQLDGQTVQLPTRHTYLMLHKPVGYICSRTQQGSDPTIYDLLPPQNRRLRPAGRLDRDSSGLVLLSDDGRFIQRYTHPRENKAKHYEVEVDRNLTPATLQQLRQGLALTDGLSRLHVLKHHGRQLTLSLQEGRNRQIRRTLGAVGYGIRRLHRTQIGPYQLSDLKSGHWRELTPGEVAT